MTGDYQPPTLDEAVAGAFDAPWRTRGEHVISAKGLGIAEVITAVPFEKVEAIARLIAAAPEMAAALARLKEWTETRHQGATLAGQHARWRTVMADLLAALEAAEAGSSRREGD